MTLAMPVAVEVQVLTVIGSGFEVELLPELLLLLVVSSFLQALKLAARASSSPQVERRGIN